MRYPGLQALRSAFNEWNEQWPHSGLDGRESMAMLYMEDRDEQLTVAYLQVYPVQYTWPATVL